VPSAFGMFTD